MDKKTMSEAPTPAVADNNSLARHKIYTFATGDIDPLVSERLGRMSKTARINGFRPGHVPLRVMRQRWGGQCLSEILTEKANVRFAEEAAQQTGERPATAPQLAPITAGEGDYQVECRYEILPDIGAPDFSKQELRRPVLQVGEAEIDEMINRLRRDAGHYHEVARAARADDSVRVDFRALRGDEVAEEGKDRRWILDSPMLSREVSDGLLGAAAGDTREINIKHAEDHPDESSRGSEVQLQVKVHAVAELHQPELNEEFFARFGVAEGGEAAFRKMVGERLRNEVSERLRQSMHAQAMRALVVATPKFDLPRSLLQMEATSMYRQLRRDAQQRGLPEVSAQAAQVYAEAAQRVTLGLIIAQWQRREKVEVKAEEITARLDFHAENYQDPQAFKTQARKNERTMHALRLEVIEHKAAEWVLSKVTVADEPLTLSQLLDGRAV